MGSMLSLPVRILLRIWKLLNLLADKAPAKQPSPTLATLPLEILLQIVSYLPAESIVCLSLTSKDYYAALSTRFAMTFTDTDMKERFIRLLEEDVPDLMVCRGCNILYRWRRTRTFLCPRHFYQFPTHGVAITICPAHYPGRMYREVVDLFVRGHAKGCAYGLPLSKLAHECDQTNLWRAVEGRVIGGKLMVHVAAETSISTPSFDSITPDATGFRGFDLFDRFTALSPFIKDTLMEIDRFRGIGCHHSRRTLPAVILDAIMHMGNESGEKRLCHNLLNCAHCATDLRVRVEAEEEGSIGIRADVWHCFGGRDSGEEDVMVDAMFRWPYQMNTTFDPTAPPNRDLEQLYNEEAGDEGCSRSLEATEGRRSWLQLWKWGYHPASGRLCRYRSPDDEDATTDRASQRDLTIQCVAQ